MEIAQWFRLSPPAWAAIGSCALAAGAAGATAAARHPVSYRADTVVRVQQAVSTPFERLESFAVVDALAREYVRFIAASEAIEHQITREVFARGVRLHAPVRLDAHVGRDGSLIRMSARSRSAGAALTAATLAPAAVRAVANRSGNLGGHVILVQAPRAAAPVRRSAAGAALVGVAAGLVLNAALLTLFRLFHPRVDVHAPNPELPIVATIPALSRRARGR